MALFFQTITEVKTAHATQSEELTALKKDVEQKDSMKDMQKQVESVLKKQISDLTTRLNSTMVGRQSESEMYEEAVMRATHLETTVTELNAKVSASFGSWEEMPLFSSFLSLTCNFIPVSSSFHFLE